MKAFAKNKKWQILFVALAVLGTLVFEPAQAQVREPAAFYRGLSSLTGSHSENSIDLSLIADFESFKNETKAPIWNELVPAQLSNSSDPQALAKQFADQGISRFVQSENFRGTSLGRTTRNVEQKMKAEISIVDDDKVSHRVDFHMRALQGEAVMTYKGWGEAELQYSSLSQKADMKIAKHIRASQEVSMNYSTSPLQNISSLQYKYSF